MNGESRVWIVISRPDRLPDSDCGGAGGSRTISRRCAFVARAFEMVGPRTMAAVCGQFDEIHAFPRANTCRGLRDLSRLYRDRKSTRLNSSHQIISYAVFCLKKKN